jgi:hypothetical protein
MEKMGPGRPLGIGGCRAAVSLSTENIEDLDEDLIRRAYEIPLEDVVIESE